MPAEPVIAGNPSMRWIREFKSRGARHNFLFYIFGGNCIPSIFSAFSRVCFVMWTSASLAFFVSSSSAARTGWDS